MSLWGPVGTNAEATVWNWWEALDSVGGHGSSELSAKTRCAFVGYWEKQDSRNQVASAATPTDILVSHFVIQRADTRELLLLVANFGEKPLRNATAEIPVDPAGAWAVQRAWPAGAGAAAHRGNFVIADIQQHELVYVHLAS